MNRRMMRGGIGALALVGLLLSNPAVALTRRATPVAPGGTECAVEPLTQEEALAVVEPNGTPISYLPHDADGSSAVTVVGSADAETEQAIRETVSQLIACGNAGRPLSTYALYTDAFLVSQVNGEAIRHPFAGETPRVTLLDVPFIRMLSDGRAFVIVVASTNDVPIISSSLFLEQVDGRWLLDNVA